MPMMWALKLTYIIARIDNVHPAQAYGMNPAQMAAGVVVNGDYGAITIHALDNKHMPMPPCRHAGGRRGGRKLAPVGRQIQIANRMAEHLDGCAAAAILARGAPCRMGDDPL